MNTKLSALYVALLLTTSANAQSIIPLPEVDYSTILSGTYDVHETCTIGEDCSALPAYNFIDNGVLLHNQSSQYGNTLANVLLESTGINDVGFVNRANAIFTAESLELQTTGSDVLFSIEKDGRVQLDWLSIEAAGNVQFVNHGTITESNVDSGVMSIIGNIKTGQVVNIQNDGLINLNAGPLSFTAQGDNNATPTLHFYNSDRGEIHAAGLNIVSDDNNLLANQATVYALNQGKITLPEGNFEIYGNHIYFENKGDILKFQSFALDNSTPYGTNNNAIINFTNSGNLISTVDPVDQTPTGVVSFSSIDNASINVLNTGTIKLENLSLAANDNARLGLINNGDLTSRNITLITARDSILKLENTRVINTEEISIQSSDDNTRAHFDNRGSIRFSDTLNTPGGRLSINAGNITLSNSGSITDFHDFSVVSEGALTLNNSGQVIGDFSQTDVAPEITLQHKDQTLTLNNMATGTIYVEDIYISNMGTASGDTLINNQGQMTFNTFQLSNNAGQSRLINDGTITLTKGEQNPIFIDLDDSNAEFVNNPLGYIGFATPQQRVGVAEIDMTVEKFINRGILDLRTSTVGNTATITGNYISDGGALYLNSILDKGSANGGKGISDLLVVNGDIQALTPTKIFITPFAGSTNVLINDPDRIALVQYTGTSADNAFVLGQKTTSGQYEYILQHDPFNQKNWYLSNTLLPPEPNPGTNGGIGSAHTKQFRLYNPAISAYMAAQSEAVAMFQHALIDKVNGQNSLNNDATHPFVWSYVQKSGNSFNGYSNAFKSRNDTVTLHFGGDLGVWEVAQGYLHFGLMAGYGETKNKSRTKLSGTRAEAEIKGVALGAYATWFQNQDQRLGLYLDNWIQIGQYRNTITGEAQNQAQKYNSRVVSLSTEAGYGIALHQWDNRALIVTPQMQFTYHYYQGKNFTDANRLNVTSRNAHSLNSRVGAKLQLASVAKNRIDPYIETNYLFSSSKHTMDFNRIRYAEDRPRNLFEVKAGANGMVNDQLTIGTNISGKWGKNHFKEYKVELQASYRW